MDVASTDRTGLDAQSMEQRFTAPLARLCLWMGPLAIFIFAVGFIGCARFIPVVGPEVSAQAAVDMFIGNRFGLQVGFTLMMTAGALLVPWAVVLAIWTRKTEARFPTMTYVQLVSLAVSICFFVLLFTIWITAAFRAGQIDPQITQMLYDFGWIVFLFDVPPFSVWIAALGLAVLFNPSKYQMYPRWAGWYCFLEAVMLVPAMSVPFFHYGPFAYNGILALWMPLASFMTWLATMTVLGFRALRRQQNIEASIATGLTSFSSSTQGGERG